MWHCCLILLLQLVPDGHGCDKYLKVRVAYTTESREMWKPKDVYLSKSSTIVNQTDIPSIHPAVNYNFKLTVYNNENKTAEIVQPWSSSGKMFQTIRKT